jgi:hypothetical protein
MLLDLTAMIKEKSSAELKLHASVHGAYGAERQMLFEALS